MRKQSLLPVDALLNSLFRDLGMSERIRIEALKRQWRNIFAEPLSIHTAPMEIRGDKLIIAVDSPAWLQHLKFLKKEISEKLANHGIKIIQLKLGSVRLDRERPIPGITAPPEAFRKLTSNDIACIDSAVAGIGDTDLRDVVRHLMEKAASRKMCDS